MTPFIFFKVLSDLWRKAQFSFLYWHPLNLNAFYHIFMNIKLYFINISLIWVFLYIIFVPLIPGFWGLLLGLLILVVILYIMTIFLLKDTNTSLNTLPFLLLVVFGITFGILSLYSTDFINLYCCLEGLGLTTLFLVSRNYLRYGSKELFFKYFCFTSFSSILLLLGIGLLFFLTNSFDFLTLKLIFFNFNHIFINANWLYGTTTILSLQYSLFFVAILLVITSFCFKLGAFPFHFIIPELYEATSIPFLIYYSLFVKPIYLLIFVQLSYNLLEELMQLCSIVLLGVGLGSIFVGTLGALTQLSLWRLIGFASIVQIGLVLLSLSFNTLSNLAVSSLFFFSYLITFLLFLFGIIWLCIFKSSETSRLPLQFYIKSDLLLNHLVKDLSTQRWCLTVISIAMASSAALPPLLGFFSKYLLLLSILTQENVALIIFILLFNIVSSFYYLRVISLLWYYTGVNNLYTTGVARYFQKKIKSLIRPRSLLKVFPSWSLLKQDLWFTYNFFSIYNIVFLMSPIFLNSLLTHFYHLALVLLHIKN